MSYDVPLNVRKWNQATAQTKGRLWPMFRATSCCLSWPSFSAGHRTEPSHKWSWNVMDIYIHDIMIRYKHDNCNI